MKFDLSDSEKKKIEEAVKIAETKTSGEIVPFLKMSCSNYSFTIWKSAFVGGGLFLGLSFILANSIIWLPTWFSGSEFILLSFVFGGLLFGLIGRLASVKRLLAGPYFDEIVKTTALATFTNEQVFKTRDRTGVLIFVSFFEQRVEIIGDEGINKRVKPEDWQKAVDLIIAGIKNNNFAVGLIDSIVFCGNLLENKNVEIKEDDTNELSNRLRVE